MSDTKPQIQEAQRTKLYIGISFSNYRKSKIKKKEILKEARAKKHLTYREAILRVRSNFSGIT